MTDGVAYASEDCGDNDDHDYPDGCSIGHR